MTIRFPILRWIICSSLSILSAALAGSLLLQGYLAIWHPSSFGRFTEFPAILLYAVWITTTAFLVLVAPIHFWIRRTGRVITPAAGFIVGSVLGCLAMMVFTAITGWPMRDGELLASSIAGAVGSAIYARLVFNRGLGKSV